MTGSHVPLDHVLFVLLVCGSPLVDLWMYPWLIRTTAAGTPGVRARVYLIAMLVSWGFTACVIALWIARHRPWTALRLGAAPPLRLAIGLVLAALYIGMAWKQTRAIVARPDRLQRIRSKFGSADALMPRTPAEHRGFLLLSITAGICEELLFRGFLMWYVAVWAVPALGSWAGLALAVVISSILFGAAHVYLGVVHVLRTSIVGAVFAIIVLASGSLAPAIIIHAGMDLVAGHLASTRSPQAPHRTPIRTCQLRLE